MFPYEPIPGCYYNTLRAGHVKYTGDGEGVSLTTKRKVQVSRKNVTARIVAYNWIKGCAEGLGCRAEITTSGGVHVFGDLKKLEEINKILRVTHGFFPSLALSCYINGEATDGYPRIEIHPAMVVDDTVLL